MPTFKTIKKYIFKFSVLYCFLYMLKSLFLILLFKQIRAVLQHV